MTATIKIDFKQLGEVVFPAIVTASHADDKFIFSDTAQEIDKQFGGLLTKVAQSTDFKAKSGQHRVIHSNDGTVILLGTGDDILGGKTAEDLGGHIFSAMGSASFESCGLYIDGSAAVLADIAHGAYLASYRFNRYFTVGDAAELKTKFLTVFSADTAAAEADYQLRYELSMGVFLARDLVTEPANILYPADYANRCLELAQYGLKISVLDEAALRAEGMELLLSVGQGSRRESRVVVMEWQGGGDESPLALVGKGVCFDTGGISIKPAGGMEDMKWDMGGSAAVVGAMRAIAGRKTRRNVIGIVGLVENMPDGEATRPGDVVKSMSGQTVEIINTDAEGRLVLADLMTYVQTHFAPSAMVDLATLTGAILVALGKEQAGLFSNDDDLAAAISSAGSDVGEKVWRMPLGKAYDDMLKSHIADMKNIGGRLAGSITAACFLQRFVKDVPWAHLDIAGMAWSDKSAPITPKGGTGYGVRLLTRLVENKT